MEDDDETRFVIYSFNRYVSDKRMNLGFLCENVRHANRMLDIILLHTTPSEKGHHYLVFENNEHRINVRAFSITNHQAMRGFRGHIAIHPIVYEFMHPAFENDRERALEIALHCNLRN